MSVFSVDSDTYHADQLGTDQPTLSASIAKVLLNESPAHAKARHPRLTDKPIVRDDKDSFDMGTCVHAMLLENDHSAIDVYDYPDWRTKDARSSRDHARLHGRTPMLRHQYEQAIAIAETARERIGGLLARPTPFTDGTAEATIQWQEQNGVYCRARLDWLHTGNTLIRDLKTTSRSANPHGIERTIFSMGYDVSASFYVRGIKAVFGVDARFDWVFVETEWPHAVSMLTLGSDALAFAEAKVDRAISLWHDCLESGDWPAYPATIQTVDAPPWAEMDWARTVAA